MIGLLVDLAGFAALNSWKKSQEIKKALYLSEKRPRALPLIDSKVKQLAGNPTKFQQDRAKDVAKVARFLVHTKAFETAIAGVLNPKSKIRTKGQRRVAEVSTYL